MKTLIKRTDFTDKSTIGEFYINEEFICYTLEDVVREPGIKVYGETAIPYGKYGVKITYSPKYKKDMPLIYNDCEELDVDYNGKDMFKGIRIHSGNYPKDTEGCVLVGNTKGKDYIGNSRDAYKKLFKILVETKEYITLEIV